MGVDPVADEPETETADAAPTNAELDQRVAGVESKLDLILEKLSGGGAPPAPQRVKTIEERLEGMAERTPQPPERRVERIMWGAR